MKKILIALCLVLTTSVSAQLAGVARVNKSNQWSAPQTFQDITVQGVCTGCGASAGSPAEFANLYINAVDGIDLGAYSASAVQVSYSPTYGIYDDYGLNLVATMKSCAECEGWGGDQFTTGAFVSAEVDSLVPISNFNKKKLNGLIATASLDLAGATILEMYGSKSYSNVYSGSASTVWGLDAAVTHLGAGTIATGYGVRSSVGPAYGTGTITNGYSFLGSSSRAAGATFTNYAGVAVSGGASGIVNYTGVLLGTTSIPAGNWAVYSSLEYPSLLQSQYVSSLEVDTYNALQSIDWNKGNVHSVVLTGNITTLTLSNPIAGGRYAIVFTHSGGARTVAWPASVKWSGGVAPTLSASGKKDVITCLYDGTDYLCGAALNF